MALGGLSQTALAVGMLSDWSSAPGCLAREGGVGDGPGCLASLRPRGSPPTPLPGGSPSAERWPWSLTSSPEPSAGAPLSGNVCRCMASPFTATGPEGRTPSHPLCLGESDALQPAAFCPLGSALSKGGLSPRSSVMIQQFSTER